MLKSRRFILCFRQEKFICTAQLYPFEFSALDQMAPGNDLEAYIIDMHSNNEFSEVTGISVLAKKIVKMKKDILYPLFYLLMTLTIILPVSSTTIERAFFAMHIIENRLNDQMRGVD